MLLIQISTWLVQLQNIVTIVKHWQNAQQTHINNITDEGLRNPNNNGYIQRVNRQDGKGEFLFVIWK